MTTTVTAVTRPALTMAHVDISNWIGARLERVRADLDEAKEQLAVARARKWATDGLSRQMRRLQQHETFLAKVSGAIAAGYAIVPNFQIGQMLAVRSEKEPPRGTLEAKPRVGAARLPAGRGEYVSPEPEFESWQEERTRERNGKRETYTVTLFSTTQHAPVDVPLVLMKKELADVLHTALQEKLFDEIGIVSDTPRGDPVLVGRIRHPRNIGRWDTQGVTFFIGWWFNVETLEA